MRSRRPSRRIAVAAVALILALVAAWSFAPEDPARLRARAEAETRAGDWRAALRDWRAVNETRLVRGRTYLAEARACLALDRAAEAERALRRAVAADPSDPEPWRLWLELLRVEDRLDEARRVGWEAYASVPPAARREVLRELTLALLADLPAEMARATLDRWIAADPADLEARVAWLRRIAANPQSGDPDRAARIETLAALLDRAPGHRAAREALVTELADAGEPVRGRSVLEAWPDAARDARYWRLQGRWDLDYDHQPGRAVEAFERVLADRPDDWKTRYRLARALRILGRSAEAQAAAETVVRLRESLNPDTLGRRLGAALDHRDDPAARRDLVELCTRVGLDRLAEAWRRDAEMPAAEPFLGPSAAKFTRPG